MLLDVYVVITAATSALIKPASERIASLSKLPCRKPKKPRSNARERARARALREALACARKRKTIKFAPLTAPHRTDCITSVFVPAAAGCRRRRDECSAYQKLSAFSNILLGWCAHAGAGAGATAVNSAEANNDGGRHLHRRRRCAPANLPRRCEPKMMMRCARVMFN